MNQQTDIARLFEQSEAHALNIARILGAYYQELIKNGIPESLAYELIKAFDIQLRGVQPPK